MSEFISFKTRVKTVAIEKSKIYKEKFVDKEYLVYSPNFSIQNFYILSSTKQNYKHLIGVHSHLKAEDFFDKCYNGTLDENDFDFNFPNKIEKEVKGSVRRKITALEDLESLIHSGSKIEENFVKNRVHCNVATANLKITLGFAGSDKLRTKTLMKGYELGATAITPELILEKNQEDEKFNKIVVGNNEIVEKYCLSMQEYHQISDELLSDKIKKSFDTFERTEKSDTSTVDKSRVEEVLVK